MEEYKACKDRFLQALQKCEIYTDYLEKKKELDRYPEKRRIVNDFRRRNYEFRSSQYTQNYHDVLDQLAVKIENIREDRVIDEFFAAELALCRLIQELLMEIMGSIEMEMDFM